MIKLRDLLARLRGDTTTTVTRITGDSPSHRVDDDLHHWP